MTNHPTEQWAGDRGRCDSWVGCICTIVQRHFYRIVATSVTESRHGTSACLTRSELGSATLFRWLSVGYLVSSPPPSSSFTTSGRGEAREASKAARERF